jgi:hypothetical protein
MPDCFINASNPRFIEHTNRILYANDRVIGFVEDNHLIVKMCDAYPISSRCQGCEMTNRSMPSVFSSHYAVPTKEGVLFLFDGKTFILVYEEAFQAEEHLIDLQKFGLIATRPFYVGNDNAIFATTNRNRVQVILYDYVTRKRVSQSTSFDVHNASDFKLHEGFCYAVFDKTVISCFDIATCRTQWKKFDAGIIDGELVFGKDQIYYGAGGLLKIIHADGHTEPIRISEQVVGVLSPIGNGLLACACQRERGHAVAIVDLKTHKTEMAVPCNLPVKRFIPGRGLYNGTPVDILVFCASNRVGVINLATGKVEHIEKISGAFYIDAFGNHVLIQRNGGSSVLLQGVQQ